MVNEHNAIEVKGLSKTFNGTVAVNVISFNVAKGELFGFLGPNGAGKTTTVRMLTGVLKPSDGTATIQGHDICSEALQSRAHIAVVPEEANVYLDMSVWQNIMLMADLYGVPRKQRTSKAVELLESLWLSDRREHKARTLSKGLRQRLMLCAALVSEPEILFLDEPTSGLDVQSRQIIHKIIRQLSDEGLTIFLTTHNMEEAEKLCSRVAIINEGEIAAIDTPDRLRSAIQARQYVEVVFSDNKLSTQELESLSGVSSVDLSSNAIRVYTETPGKTATEIAFLAKTRDMDVEQLCTRKPSLQEVFLYFTNQDKKEAKQ
ncbi:MAG: ATP-binding cassette domain-containing protein [Planctomycetes bacterium]|nr:ATP-binding cassette domain-containing protein [Planctomycetota bacterium]